MAKDGIRREEFMKRSQKDKTGHSCSNIEATCVRIPRNCEAAPYTRARARSSRRDLHVTLVCTAARYVLRVHSPSTGARYMDIIYRCEALDVRFPMALEPSHLDLCSSSYNQTSDKRSGLTALGEF
ncbi:hypothetical protein PIB30_014719 [Stylosanthes scabra]|uniref:Uncharacterized protein n=1 Tax=Stylosanthes scabra TaxID=79078 RepID=A0ABU6W520_9FABA|nr:hypothetical protein [Stylosanthes scabra]